MALIFFQRQSGRDIATLKTLDEWLTHPFKTLGRLTEGGATIKVCDCIVDSMAR